MTPVKEPRQGGGRDGPVSFSPTLPGNGLPPGPSAWLVLLHDRGEEEKNRLVDPLAFPDQVPVSVYLGAKPVIRAMVTSCLVTLRWLSRRPTTYS
jgi:hypothetical protein